MFKTQPNKAFRLLNKLEMAVEGLQKAANKHIVQNGPYKASGVSARMIQKKIEKLDTQKAEKVLNENGIDLLDVSDIQLTEDSIRTKLGDKKGNQLISLLKEAGAIKRFTTEYLRIQVKK